MDTLTTTPTTSTFLSHNASAPITNCESSGPLKSENNETKECKTTQQQYVNGPPDLSNHVLGSPSTEHNSVSQDLPTPSQDDILSPNHSSDTKSRRNNDFPEVPNVLTSSALADDILKWRTQKQKKTIKMEDNQEMEWADAPRHPKGFCYFVTEPNRGGDTENRIDLDRYHSQSVYKVLSVIFTGTEDYYKLIKTKVQDLIKKNLDLFEALGNRTLVQTISETGDVSQKTKEELSAIASLLKCPIGLSFNDKTLLFYPAVSSPPEFQVAPLGTVIILKLDQEARYQWTNQELRKVSKEPPDIVKTAQTQQQALADLIQLHQNDMPSIDFVNDEDLSIDLTPDQAKAFEYSNSILQPMKHAVVTTKDHNLRSKKRQKDVQQPVRHQARPRDSLPLFDPQPTNITTNMMKAAQFTDRLCVFLRELLLKKPFSFNISEKDLKHYTAQIQHFHINDDDLLVYRGHSRELRYKILPPQDRIVLPLSAVKHVLCNIHNIQTVCGGIKKTQRFANQRYWRGKIGNIPTLSQMIKSYIQCCVLCPLKSLSGDAQDPTLNAIEEATQPFEVFSLDIFSGLATTYNGMKKIAVFVDLFSRYMIAEPIRSETSKEILDALVRRVIGPYGYFSKLLSDNAANLQSIEFNDTCRRFNIQRLRILPFTPTSNGKLERIMSTFSRALRVISQKDPEWENSLPLICHSYNQSLQTTLGDTPNFVMFGRDAATIADLVLSDVEIQNKYAIGSKSPWSYGAEMQARMKNIREIYLDNIRQQSRMQIQRANKKRTEKEVLPGQLVLVLYPLKEKDKVKQTSRFVGLFRVQEVHKKKVVIAPQGGRAKYNVHIRRVRVIPTFFYEDYIHWMEADREKLLDDPINNMSDLDKHELEALPEFEQFRSTKEAYHNTKHLIDKCP